MKNWKHWTFVGIIAISVIIVGFTTCDEGNNDPKTYNVTVESLTNGSIIATPTSGVEGTEITLTVNPDDLYKLKVGTLKYGSTNIDETLLKFNLPTEDVIITAEFESKFIGIWGRYTGSNILRSRFIFFENMVLRSSGYGVVKGTWVTEVPNKLIITYTSIGWTDNMNPTIEEIMVLVDDLDNSDGWVTDIYDEEYEFEFISNSELKLNISYDLEYFEYIYKLIE
jgi:hypothetical protein